MKDHIVLLLQEILAGMGVTDVTPDVEISDVPAHGEYTTNVAMQVTKILKKSPMEIALQVVEQVKSQKSKVESDGSDQNKHQEDQNDAAKIAGNDILQAIDRVEVAPPGFINFFLTEASLSTSTSSVLEEKQGYGIRKKEKGKRKKVMVEFTDPNPFKEFHIGHLYSNAVGECLSRLFEASGCEVARADYFGEVGMHVAKAVWGMREKFQMPNAECQIEDELKEIEKLPLSERVKWMGAAYALGAQSFEEDPKAAEEMKRLNKLIFIAAQELLEEKTGKKPLLDYRKGEDIDANELADIKLLFGNGRQWSLEYFETIYARLGTTFDYYYPESEVAEYGAKLVMDHIGGVFEQSEGAVVYHGEAEGLHTRVFINKLGLPTYEAKELGLNDKKYKDWPFDASYIVTGKEITEYFHVLLSAMGKVIPKVASKTRHIGHGMVRVPEGKMSSRLGNIITGESLLNSVKQKISGILDQNESEKESIAEAAAIAAVKYSLLKVALPSDIIFDLDKSVSFDGDSGPYLLYTYARCRSVLRKSQISIPNNQQGKGNFDWKLEIGNWKLNAEERSVCRLISQFPDVVAGAAATLAPSDICTYLNRLASAFNLFYAKHTILSQNDKKDLRLTLTSATAQVLQNGLHILGIQTVERM